MEHQYGFWDDPKTWVAASFFIFFILFGSRIWAALTAMLDKRAEQVRSELAEAQKLRSEAEAMLADATRRREQAMADAKALLEGARAQAQLLSATAAADAEAAAARRERMAVDRIATAEKAALDEVRTAAAEVAAAAAERVIREGLSVEAGGALVDRAIASLPNALAPRRAA
jgi:F-type H+-transporting ATPase subunit b